MPLRDAQAGALGQGVQEARELAEAAAGGRVQAAGHQRPPVAEAAARRGLPDQRPEREQLAGADRDALDPGGRQPEVVDLVGDTHAPVAPPTRREAGGTHVAATWT